MNNIELTQIILGIILILGGIITCLLIPYLKNKIGEGKWNEIIRVVKVFVEAAEQLFQSTDGEKLGKERLEWVLAQLTDRGYDINDKMIIAAIESEVYKLQQAVFGEVLADDSTE